MGMYGLWWNFAIWINGFRHLRSEWNSSSPSPCLKVEDLARLQFQTTPVYIDVDDGRTKVTNERLLQGYLVVPCAK
ncbi:hypothetical protein JHK85_012679 [Glycine max]|nr:hypothetical protein JHK85_012679 [Glycine max]KAG5057341.1 hypothetical protein JHK86_012337 [Glycine max]